MTDERLTVCVTINGAPYERTVEPNLLLTDFIRHEAGLTGTYTLAIALRR